MATISFLVGRSTCLLALLSVALIRRSLQYPDLIVEFPDCHAHPTRAEVTPDHWTIVPDPLGTAWAPYLGEELLNQRLCPGRVNNIVVSYRASNGAPDKRRALLTSSIGSLRGPSRAESERGYLLDPRCDNRLYLAPHSANLPGYIESDAQIFTDYNVTLQLPCSAAGRTVVMRSSSATHSCLYNCGYSNIMFANWTAFVDPECAAPACRPPAPSPRPPSPRPPPPSPRPPSPQPSPPPSPEPPVDLTAPSRPPSPPPLPPPPSPGPSPPPQSPDAPPPPDAPASPRPPRPSPPPPRPPFPPAVLNIIEDPPSPPAPPQPPAPPPSCERSSMDYSCSQVLGKVRLHWTIGGAAPPANNCTGQQPRAPLGDATEPLVHFAVESDVAGYVSFGFPENPSSMYDADIVLGWVGNDGRGVVDAYHVTSYDMAPRDVVSPGWALAAAVVEDRGGAGGAARTTLCFSRRLSEPLARSSPLLNFDTGVLKYSWAISPQDALVEHPADGFGAGQIDLRTGAAAEVSISNRNGAIIAHGVLMAVAWVLLLPLGAMAPAHRWLLGDKQVFGKAIWFWLHMVMQLSGFALFAAGFILAMVRFPRPEAHTLKSAHAIAGYVIAGLAGLQVIGAFMRPDPGTQLRIWIWNPLHMHGGRATTLLAWATVFTGIMVYHESVYRGPIVPWVAPIAAVMGITLLLDTALRDARLRRVQAQKAAPAKPMHAVVVETEPPAGMGAPRVGVSVGDDVKVVAVVK